MKKLLLLLLVLFSVFFSITANSQNSLWTPSTLNKTSSLEKFKRTTVPSAFLLYKLNLAAFKTLVATAPLDSAGQLSTVQVAFPNSKGILENYLVYEAPVMEKGLALKYPELKSYIAKGINDATATIRFSVTTFGLHAMLTSSDAGTFYIDSYTKDLQNYMVYSKKSITKSKSFSCLVKDEVDGSAERGSKLQKIAVNDGKFRQYRMAMACTIEYATFHVNAAGLSGGTLAQKKAAVLSAMVVTVTRVSGLYENEMSLRFNLVANNDAIIFIDSDNFDNNDADLLIEQSQTVITSIIGSPNYDIGHTVSTGGGGLAGGSPCIDSEKAYGITGLPSPVGDAFDIDYVSHEIGHQFGANHTFNNSCDGNINPSTALEPGSGSTIMSYAGICAPNVQSTNDQYFHAISIAEMTAVVLATSCAATSSNGNFAPVVNAGPDYTIPRGTAFILKGAATDANNDALTYCWEQMDFQSSVQPPQQTSTVGPNFRSRNPSNSPDRFMPLMENVVDNNLFPIWEVVPNVARTMNFALTVRDNRTPNGGQTNRDDMIVTTSSVGPFLVNAPNTAVSWVVGANQNVTWTVAGTDANGINASFVDVLLSTDGGSTYTILLASKVPNDGSETITVPNNTGTTNRIMVRGYKHIFYDISNTNFTITAAPSSFAVAFSGVAESQNTFACTTNSTSFTFNYTAYAGFNSNITFSSTGAPVGATVSFSPNVINGTGTVMLTLGNLTGVSGDYQILVNATSGGVTKTVPFYLSLGIAQVVLTTPANNAVDQNINVNLSWNPSPVATSYDVQVATNSTFTAIVRSGNVSTSSFNASGLTSEVTYYWRVLPKNATCNGVYSNAFQFTTGTVVCATTNSTNVPLTITASGTPTVTSTITIPAGGSIADVNVILNISHVYLADITVTLTSPQGTIVGLFDGLCGSSNNAVATFDDAGVAIVCSNNPAISGTVRPASPLAAFNNQNSTGTWTLTIVDSHDTDGGRLRSWGLNICTIQPIVKWTGATSNDWAAASNWSNNLVPNGSYSIEIPLGNPVLATNFALQAGKNLRITGTGRLTISPTGVLSVAGTADFGSLPVTIQSTVAGDGIIGQITGSLLNATNVTVERYIPANRKWRVLTTPLRGSNGTLFNTWQNNGSIIAGTGVHIWGPSGTGIATGTSYSFLSYATTGTWVGVNNTTTTNLFDATRNYAYFGFPTSPYGTDRILNTTTPIATTLKATGTLLTGTVNTTINNATTTAFTLVGNPYASPLSPATLLSSSTNIRPFFWLWDPKLAVTGAYVSFDAGLGVYSNLTGSFTTSSTPIQSGQGFFVKALTVGGTGTLAINETSKASSVVNVFGKIATQQTAAVDASILRIAIYKVSSQEQIALDGAIAGFYSTANNGVDTNDVNKFPNASENIAFARDNNDLASEHFSTPQSQDEMKLRIWNTTQSSYKLAINTENFIVPNVTAILVDDFTGIQTPINLNGSMQEYPFDVTADALSSGLRFRVVFNSSTLSTSLFSIENVSVYPNPATKGVVNVQLPVGDYSGYSYELVNILGQKVLSEEIKDLEGNRFSLNTKGVANNMYVLRIVSQKKEMFTTKIIVSN